ncbi:hypothetical protein H5410_049733 [Solanum commersonii]|uniref:Uncharacterized protein n=1 Tax=Solanum commersonii TaxID=4109 RepID=A0A9J5WTP2_SOLCO|nr:hypothetical protein H5410_049733 [Solanum commersonii]
MAVLLLHFSDRLDRAVGVELDSEVSTCSTVKPEKCDRSNLFNVNQKSSSNERNVGKVHVLIIEV